MCLDISLLSLVSLRSSLDWCLMMERPEQSQNKTEHVMNVENNGPTLLTMIHLLQNFNFLYLIFSPRQDRPPGSQERYCVYCEVRREINYV